MIEVCHYRNHLDFQDGHCDNRKYQKRRGILVTQDGTVN
jgi:hypothetical protein